MALTGGGRPASGPEHAIDNQGTAETPDLTVGAGGRALHADARHLADVAAELDNLAEHLKKDLNDAADGIVKLTQLAADQSQHHYGGAVADWTNPSGRFGDADRLWARYGSAASSASTMASQLEQAISRLAAGTRTIAHRYSTTEDRNRLLAKQVESLLASSPGSSTADASSTAGADEAGGTGDGSGSTGSSGPTGSSGAGGAGGYGGGGSS